MDPRSNFVISKMPHDNSTSRHFGCAHILPNEKRAIFTGDCDEDDADDDIDLRTPGNDAIANPAEFVFIDEATRVINPSNAP